MDNMKLKKFFNSTNILFIICAIVKAFCAVYHGLNEHVVLCISWSFLALLDIVLVKLNTDEKIPNNSK
jgi:hypothetical protein